MKLINTTEAEGHVLCHDITRIIPGKEKGPVFRKGHIVTKEDIPVLLSVGKEHLYVWEKLPGILHEDEAAELLRRICMGDDATMSHTPPKEGKVEIRAEIDGVLHINKEALNRVNALGEMMIASIHGGFPVKKGDRIAATRIIPLVIEEEKLRKAEKEAGKEPIFSLRPLKPHKAVIVTTGSEVAKGLIKDAFGPVLREKLAEYQVPVLYQKIVTDEKELITATIEKAVSDGADLVLVSGGMSVDPDDKTPGAIAATGAEVVTYGAPVLPGAMFLLAYLTKGEKTIPIMGLPGCVMYAKRTIFDLVLPRVLTGERLLPSDISIYGEGGLCLSCPVCHFPNCGFGKY